MKMLPAFVGAPEINKVYNVDAMTLLKAMPDGSCDAIITDLPYGTTACTWDEIIPFAPMWAEVKRTLKPRGVFVTTASQPFTSKLVMSNIEMFKYSWVWEKTMAGMFVHAKNRPLKKHEDVLVFSQGVVNHEGLTENRMNYYPQIENNGTPYSKKSFRDRRSSDTMFGFRSSHVDYETTDKTTRYPTTILEFPNGNNGVQHPTQKPVALYEYLIRTYTQPGELVVDFCCGSGTTALAARNLKRDYIVGDSDEHYCNVARERLRQPYEPHYIKSENDLSGLPLFEMSAMRNALISHD